MILAPHIAGNPGTPTAQGSVPAPVTTGRPSGPEGSRRPASAEPVPKPTGEAPTAPGLSPPTQGAIPPGTAGRPRANRYRGLKTPRLRSRPSVIPAKAGSNRHPRRSGGQTRLKGTVGSSGPGIPMGLPKGEITKMNSLVGKSTGIALLMAAALLAALFSMGVFSATGVGAEVSDDPAPTVKVDKEGVGATNVTMTIMFEVDLDVVVDDNDTGSVNEAALSEIVVTLPDGFTGVAQASNRAAIDDTHGNNGTKVQVDGKDAEDFVPAQTQAGTHGGTVTINNSPATAGVPAQITDGDKVTVVVAGLTNPPNATLATDGEYQVSVIQGPASATNIAKTASFTLYDAVLSSDTPGAAVGVTLHTSAGTPVGQGQDIVVDLTGFGVPTTIAENRVIIDSDGQSPNDFSGYPSEVTVTGKKVTLTVPNFLPNGSEQMDLVGGIYRITFKQSAGITNPTSPGTKTIKVSDRDGTDDELKARVRSTVTVAPKLGPRGTDATVTGKGFASGQTATVYLGKVGGEVLGSGTVTGGSFSVAIDTSSDDFNAGANTITVEGGNGADAEKTATFTITGKVEIEDTESATVADTLTLKLSDWTAGDVVDVKIGGVAVDGFHTAFNALRGCVTNVGTCIETAWYGLRVACNFGVWIEDRIPLI